MKTRFLRWIGLGTMLLCLVLFWHWNFRTTDHSGSTYSASAGSAGADPSANPELAAEILSASGDQDSPGDAAAQRPSATTSRQGNLTSGQASRPMTPKPQVLRTDRREDGRWIERRRLERWPDFKYPLIRVVEREDRLTGQVVVEKMVADHVMVRLPNTTTVAEVDALLAPVGGSVREPFGRRGHYLINVPTDTLDDLDEVLAVLEAEHSPVIAASPDYIVHTMDIFPDDARLNEQWGLHNTGQNAGTVDADIDAPEAWELATGTQSNVIAIIDTGIAFDHPDLAANMWVNPGEIPDNGIDDDNNGYIDDIHGWDFSTNGSNTEPYDANRHGTHCAGVIGARTDNGQGVSGINWNIQMAAVQFLNSAGSGALSDAVLSLEYCLDNGIGISNNSWGGGGASDVMRQLLEEAAEANHLFIAAAGNAGQDADTNPMYPAAYNVGNVFSVAATDRNDELADFSNYGATTVDLGAPGVAIMSTVLQGNYGNLSGTSMATPHVAGAAALIRSLAPELHYREIMTILMESGDEIPALAGKTVSGKRLNLHGAIELASLQPPSLATEIVDDGTGASTGNGNGVAEPGEVVEIYVTFSNPWADPIVVDGVNLSETSTDLTITSQSTDTFTVPSGGAYTLASPIVVNVDAAATTPTNHVMDLVIANGNGDDWNLSLNLIVVDALLITGTVTLDGVGYEGATLDFDGLFPGKATTQVDGSYNFIAYNVDYEVSTRLEDSVRSEKVMINGASHSGAVDFAFETRTVSGVVRNAETLEPVTDEREIFLLLDSSPELYQASFSELLSTNVQPDGSYSLTYRYPRELKASLYLPPISPYYYYWHHFTLDDDYVHDIHLSSGGMSISPEHIQVSAQEGQSVTQNIAIAPVNRDRRYAVNVRLENGRSADEIDVNPYPGSAMELIETYEWGTSDGFMNGDYDISYQDFTFVGERLFRSDGYRSGVDIFDFETGQLIERREVPNGPGLGIPSDVDDSVADWYPRSMAYDYETGWLWFGGLLWRDGTGWIFAIDVETWTLQVDRTFTDQGVNQMVFGGGKLYVITNGRQNLYEIDRQTGEILVTFGINPNEDFRDTPQTAPRAFVGTPEGLWSVAQGYVGANFEPTKWLCVFAQLMDLSSPNKTQPIRQVDFVNANDLPAKYEVRTIYRAIYSHVDQRMYLIERNDYDGNTDTVLREYYFGNEGESWARFDPHQQVNSSQPSPVSFNVTGTFDAANLTPGVYKGDFVILANMTEGDEARVPVTFTVTAANTPPVITTQPQSQSLATGEALTLTVVASGGASYQWYLDDAPLTDDARISGASTSQLVINGTTLADAGVYHCVVANSAGSVVSDDAVIAIGDLPTVAITEPVSKTVGLSSTALGLSLKADAQKHDGSDPTVQWTQVSGPGVAHFSDMNAETTTVQFPEEGNYDLRITASDNDLQAFDSITVAVGPGTGQDLAAPEVGWWKLDESSGTSAQDSTTPANDGTLSGFAGNPWRAAKWDNGLYFDGSDQAVVIPDADNLDGFSAATFTFWVNPDTDDDSARGLISKRRKHNSDTAYSIFLFNDNKLAGDIADYSLQERFFSDASIAVGVWTHVAVVFDGSLNASERVRVYLNGVLDSTHDENSSTIAATAAALNLGRLGGSTATHLGGLDDVRIYNRVLADDEIRDVMQGSINYGPDIHFTFSGPAPVGNPLAVSATVTDDGLPGGSPTTQWTGAGVAFEDDSSLATNATFSTLGDYPIRLHASDGDATTWQELTVSVTPEVLDYTSWTNGINWQGRDQSPDSLENAYRLPNAVLFAMDLDPLTWDASGMPMVDPGPAMPSLSFTYRRSKQIPSLTLYPQYSHDLIKWLPVDPNSDQVTQTIINPDVDGDNSAELVQVIIHGATYPLFLHLVVD